MRKIKKLAVYSTIGALVMTNLTGCLGQRKEVAEEGKKDTGIETTQTEEEIFNNNLSLEQLQEHIKEGETRIFEPYQHLFFVRVDLFSKTGEYNPENISGLSVSLPEGYKVLTIENFSIYKGETAGYDIWFTNEVPVEVTSIYNEALEAYDFSHFGLPIEEKEKENEETIQKVK